MLFGFQERDVRCGFGAVTAVRHLAIDGIARTKRIANRDAIVERHEEGTVLEYLSKKDSVSHAYYTLVKR